MSSRSSGPVASILDVIGDTPLLRIDGIWAKLEFLSPSGSIKARIAKFMIERAEQEGTDIEIHYEDHGNGQPVVLIHGYPLNGTPGSARSASCSRTGTA